MSRARCQAGASAVEYLGVVTVVVVLLGGLLTVGEHRVRREAPVDPVAEVGRLLARPAPPRPPRARPAVRPRHRPVNRPRRPALPPRPVVEVPRWAAGGW